jgi:hypothetical protein
MNDAACWSAPTWHLVFSQWDTLQERIGTRFFAPITTPRRATQLEYALMPIPSSHKITTTRRGIQRMSPSTNRSRLSSGTYQLGIGFGRARSSSKTTPSFDCNVPKPRPRFSVRRAAQKRSAIPWFPLLINAAACKASAIFSTNHRAPNSPLVPICFFESREATKRSKIELTPVADAIS